jgi:hypothetical protein
MARFCDILEGTRAVKVIDLPLANVPHGLQRGTEEQARARELNPKAYKPRKVGLRALLPFERERVLELAAARAKAKGGQCTETDPLFRHALAVYTVAVACVDPDTEPNADPKLFFGDTIESAAEKLRTSKHMTDDIVFYLRERQEQWQDEINPQVLTIADDQLWEATKKAADEEAGIDFLALMRGGMLLRFTQLLACQLLLSLEDRLPPTTTEPSPGIAQ